jgi:hypothetical protein
MTLLRADLHPSMAANGRVRSTVVAATVATAIGVFLAPVAISQTASSPPSFEAGPLTLTFGGFTAFEAVFRNKNQTADIGSNYNGGIPFPNVPNAHINEFRASARQSRFSFLVQGPETGSLRAESYMETDFLSAGTTSNSSESNSYTLRIRHFYGLLRDSDAQWYVLGGQNWSLATLYANAQLNPRTERIPQTIDAQYVAGFNWTRNPQIRFVKSFGKMFSAGLSLESPQASFQGTAPPAPNNNIITTNPGGPGGLLNSAANYSIDFAPDIIVKFAVDPGYGHYELYGLGRGFRDRVVTGTVPAGTTVNGTAAGIAAGTNNTTWAGSIGAGMILPLVPKTLEFQASGLAGSGNGRYGSAQLPDVTYRPDGTPAAVREWQALAGLIMKPISELTIYVYFGEEKASRTAYTNAAGTVGIGYGSELFNNSGCYSLTGAANTCVGNTQSIQHIAVGEWWKVYSGEIGNIQIGAQYSYLQRRTFSGVGGDPSATISMGFLSFRYYPYQK